MLFCWRLARNLKIVDSSESVGDVLEPTLRDTPDPRREAPIDPHPNPDPIGEQVEVRGATACCPQPKPDPITGALVCEITVVAPHPFPELDEVGIGIPSVGAEVAQKNPEQLTTQLNGFNKEQVAIPVLIIGEVVVVVVAVSVVVVVVVVVDVVVESVVVVIGGGDVVVSVVSVEVITGVGVVRSLQASNCVFKH